MPTAASPNSTSLTLLLGFGGFATAESDMTQAKKTRCCERAGRLRGKDACENRRNQAEGELQVQLCDLDVVTEGPARRLTFKYHGPSLCVFEQRTDGSFNPQVDHAMALRSLGGGQSGPGRRDGDGGPE